MQGLNASRSAISAIAIAALSTVVLTASTASAADHPIAGKKLKLKRSASGKSILKFVVKDSGIPFPSPPEVGTNPFDAGLTLFSLAGPNGGVRPLRQTIGEFEPEFDVSGSPGTYKHRFRHKTAPDEESQFKLVLWREGRDLKIVLKDAVLPLDAPTGGVALRWRWESASETENLCTVFTGASIRRDKIGSFSGADAPAPALVDCSDDSLAGVVAPSVCGDGVVSGSEECDGPNSCDLSENSVIADPFSDCGTAAAGNECTCCSETGGLLTAQLPCCRPSIVVQLPAPPLGGDYFCLSNSCDPPFECDEGDSCLPDLTCCGGEGSLCTVGRTCCGSLACSQDLLAGSPFVFRCQPPTACTVNADCVTDFCDGGLCADP